MRIIRSFPDEPVPGRAYVQDDLERLYNRPYDYSGLKQFSEDILLLEWDIAVSREDLARFQAQNEGNEWPQVAPFKLPRPGKTDHYAHWRCEGENVRPIWKGERSCDLFGLGMIYLPNWIIQGCPIGYQGSSIMSDGTIPRWLREQPQWRPIPIDWSITAVHVR